MPKNGKRAIVAVMDDHFSVADALEPHGAVCLDIGTLAELKECLPHVDAVVLTGGGDIQSSKYGVTGRHTRSYGYDTLRDQREFIAVIQARKRGIPLMGICRGHQMINVAHGGSLHQHLPDLAGTDGSHSGVPHSVVLRAEAQVAQGIGADSIPRVTSLHHQGVDRLGEGLVPVGWAEDGTVEMIESAPGLRPYVLGCQFHPELDWSTTGPGGDEAWLIFRHFMRKVKQHASGKGRVANRLKDVEHLTWGGKTSAKMAAASSAAVRHSEYVRDQLDSYRGGYWQRPLSSPGGGVWVPYGGGHEADDEELDPKEVVAEVIAAAEVEVECSTEFEAESENLDDDQEKLDQWLEDHNSSWYDVPLDEFLELTTDREVPFWMDPLELEEVDSICASEDDRCKTPGDCTMWGDCAIKAVASAAARDLLMGRDTRPITEVTDISVVRALQEEVDQHKRGNPRKKGRGRRGGRNK